MVRSGHVAFILLMSLVFVQVARADDPQAGAPLEGSDAAAAVERILAVIDVVLANHIEPPTRQQMVLEVAQTLMQQTADGKPADLSIQAAQALAREVSDLSTPDELRTFLAEHWTQSLARSQLTEDGLESRVFERLGHSLGGVRVMDAKEYAVNRQLAANRYVGIGIALVGPMEEGGIPVIGRVFEGGPADRVGAREGDLIEQVDGRDSKGMPLKEVVDLLRGPRGTEVNLVLRQPSDDERREYTITRGVVPIKTVQFSGLSSDGEPSLGVLRFEGVNASAPHELRRIEQALEEDVRGILLDLRGVGGSDPHFGVLLANALLDGGTIGSVQDGRSTKKFEAGRDCVFRNLPLAVLVDEQTSGTAEWVAAALQDNGRAAVVGQLTRGHGYVMEGVAVPNTEYVAILRTAVLVRKNGEPLTASAKTHIFRPEFAMMQRLIERRVKPQFVVDTVSPSSGDAPDAVLAKADETLRFQINAKERAEADQENE